MPEENAKPAIGDKMPDGSIYAGESPDTGKAMYVTAKDAGLTMTFNKAKEYASKLDAHGHKDWRVPTDSELDVLLMNQETGALKGTFNLNASSHDAWYWSSEATYNNRHGVYAYCRMIWEFMSGKGIMLSGGVGAGHKRVDNLLSVR